MNHSHEMPHKAQRSSEFYNMFSNSEPARYFVSRLFKAEIPPEIIDEFALLKMAQYINLYGVERAVEEVKYQLPRSVLVEMRAVRINLARMRGKGISIWAK
jgi:hypothetical protein